MRLRKIRLAGFKSFVDPTTITVPANLVGIVGPNGCGKSNIIDAVTWVMGESSAKHLRGEMLTDVIFNGSASRQPVGQASVELIFDNSENRLGGQYASYNEISIKRQMDREGVSNYFLNGTRCRRKDIQSIFLGTGLGPRSYAIIEQGMISRLIEAKPDELRSFIEEAAGISKYRERRRETENRIRHTRENMNRLGDIREELGRQLGHLQRQSRAAERYQQFKQEERRLRAELLALQWRDLGAQSQARQNTVREEENRVEEAMASLRASEAEMERIRNDMTSANDAFNNAQSRYYEISGEISQLEQKIQNAEERIESMTAEVAVAEAARAKAEEQGSNDAQRLRQLVADAAALQPRLEGSRSESSDAYTALNQAEQAVQGWQAEWDAMQQTVAEYANRTVAARARIEYLQTALEEIQEHRRDLQGEIEADHCAPLVVQVQDSAQALAKLETAVAGCRRDVEDRQAEFRDGRHAAEQAAIALNELRSGLQEINTGIATLEALQSNADGVDARPSADWLQSSGLGRHPRLVDKLKVDDAWSLAVEMVLGERLQDYCVDGFDAAVAELGRLDRGRVGIVDLPGAEQQQVPPRHPRLLEKISSPWSLEPLLGDIFIAGSFAEALQWRDGLQEHETVLTRDCIWMGRNWARVFRPAARESGLLAREKVLQHKRAEQRRLEAEIAALGSQLATRQQQIETAERELEAAQKQVDALQTQLAEQRSRDVELTLRLDEARRRDEAAREELEELGITQQGYEDELRSLQERLAQADLDEDRIGEQRERLTGLRAQHRASLDEARTRWQSTHEKSHEIALRLESISSQKASIEQAIQRTRLQIDHFAAQLGELGRNIDTTREPVAGYRSRLEARLAEKVAAEKELSSIRDRVQSLDAGLRDRDRERTEIERRVEELRGGLDQARLAAQEVTIRLQTLAEQLQALEQQPETLLEEIEAGAAAAAWQEKLAAIERRIERLGPINLAAIDEFRQLSERKEYLDRQNADLVEALTTLETAIRKIDKESRTRFQETFERLNSNLKEMFPILFGGGHAYLEMTGEDLLETGISVMARPPGKRNSSIHVLSGGEKALIAVALVFAIFKLNPAPFCILDEVDAPLDDSNVGRFSQLVLEMSQDVQFVFITHNKITMEIAHQLMGVTMQEAGVSRLVSVDVDEAVKMAATA